MGRAASTGPHGPRHGRNLYGTLSDDSTTATHVVCPICGKSSSLKSFPAGGGTDIVLQTFQGMGRGKGFSVISRESGINDHQLAEALKPKLLDLLAVLAAHGHITKREIDDSVGGPAETILIEVPPAGIARTRALETELKAERTTREFLEDEITELQNGMTKLLKQWREAERRDALSQRKLGDLRARTDRIIVAAREGVESLQRLRAGMRSTDRGASELSDHVRKMRAVVESVQSLRAAQQPTRHERREAHDAR